MLMRDCLSTATILHNALSRSALGSKLHPRSDNRYNETTVKPAALATSPRGRFRYPMILLRQMVITNFKLRYQGSVLGYLWSLLKPLVMFLILDIVFLRFLKIGNTL